MKIGKTGIFQYFGCVSFAGLIGGGLAFLAAISAFIFTIAAPTDNVDLNGIPEAGPTELTTLPTGTRVFVTGTLEGNPQASITDLVAYQRSTWKEDASGDLSQEYLDSYVPTLQISTLSGLVMMVPDSQTSLLDRDLRTGDPSFSSGGLQYIYRGLDNGDIVTVMGTKVENDKILGEEIIRGLPEDMLNYHEKSNSNSKTMVLALFGFSVIFVGSAFLLAWARKSRFGNHY
jgi:hypothetical protein